MDVITFETQSGVKKQIDLDLYDDSTDVNNRISLFENCILRDSKTWQTLFFYWRVNQDDYIIDEESDYSGLGFIVEKIITPEDVIEALREHDLGFYSYIGSTIEKEIQYIRQNPEHLANIIHALNSYSNHFLD